MPTYDKNNGEYRLLLNKVMTEDVSDLASNTKLFERLSFSRMSHLDIDLAFEMYVEAVEKKTSGLSFRQILNRIFLPTAIQRTQRAGEILVPVGAPHFMISIPAIMELQAPTDLWWFLRTFETPDRFGCMRVRAPGSLKKSQMFLGEDKYDHVRAKHLDDCLLRDKIPVLRKCSQSSSQTGPAYQLITNQGFFLPQSGDLLDV